MKFVKTILILFVIGAVTGICIFLLNWSDDIDDSIIPGIIIGFSFVFYGALLVSVIWHIEELLSERSLQLVVILALIYCYIVLFCYLLIRNISIVNKPFCLVALGVFIGVFIACQGHFLFGNLDNSKLKIGEIYLIVICIFFLHGIVFSFAMGSDDSKLRNENKGYSLKFDKKDPRSGEPGDSSNAKKAPFKRIGECEVKFLEARTTLVSKDDFSKIENIVKNTIIPNLKQGSMVTVYIESYADCRPIIYHTKTYPSNYELTVERSNRVKWLIMDEIKKYRSNGNQDDFVNNIHFIETNYSCEYASDYSFHNDRKTHIEAYREQEPYKPDWVDYLYLGFVGFNINPMTSYMKTIVIFKYVTQVLVITSLLGIISLDQPQPKPVRKRRKEKLWNS